MVLSKLEWKRKMQEKIKEEEESGFTDCSIKMGRRLIKALVRG